MEKFAPKYDKEYHDEVKVVDCQYTNQYLPTDPVEQLAYDCQQLNVNDCEIMTNDLIGSIVHYGIVRDSKIPLHGKKMGAKFHPLARRAWDLYPPNQDELTHEILSTLAESTLTEDSRYAQIELSRDLCTNPLKLLNTIAHEFCHATSWIVDNDLEGHGEKWKKWCNILENEFPALPSISEFHNYNAMIRYHYKCTCGYEVFKYQKDIDKKCSKCGEQLKIFVQTHYQLVQLKDIPLH